MSTTQITQTGSDRKYGCHNAPRFKLSQPVTVQSGWHHSWMRKLINVPHFSKENDCKYDAQKTDKYCAGCCHIKD